MKIPDERPRLSVGVMEHRLCTRCGTCIGICPEQALELDEDLFPRLLANRCTDCGLCHIVCPGGEVDWGDLTKQVYNKTEISVTFDGYFRDSMVGYATKETIRTKGSGGGIVTALLTDLLENGLIDGCVVTRMNSQYPWCGESFIARNVDELMASQGSRYMIIPMNIHLAKIMESEGKYAIAALPCQVHGLRKAMALMPELAQKIPLIIGLYCGGSLEPFVVSELLAAKGIDRQQLHHFEFRGGQWPGRIRAILKNGKMRNLHYSNYKDGGYNYIILLYMPFRCQTCIDGSNEFADLAVGDSWTRDEHGRYKFSDHSKILIRTEQGERALQAALKRGAINACSVSSDPSYRTQKLQSLRKGLTAPLRIERWGKKGLPVPVYGKPVPIASIKEHLTEKLISGILYAGRFRMIRLPLMRFFTSFAAIPLIWFRKLLKRRKYRKMRNRYAEK